MELLDILSGGKKHGRSNARIILCNVLVCNRIFSSYYSSRMQVISSIIELMEIKERR